MWIAPFIVGFGFSKLRGQTWTSSAIYSGAVTWTAVQVRRGALLRLVTAGNTLMSLTLWNLTAGVALGVAGGVGTSRLLFGKEGQVDAIDFYTGKVSAPLYIETLKKAPGRVAASIQANRAVEGNAGGVMTGQNMDVAPGLQEQHDWTVSNRERWMIEMRK